jgi:chromosome segregation ATPase
LEQVVDKVNALFANYFRRIGCTGSVHLSNKDDDPEKHAIEVLVSFRSNQKSRVLTASSQSGGERAVTTIIYLLCLQHVTNCPFRYAGVHLLSPYVAHARLSLFFLWCACGVVW